MDQCYSNLGCPTVTFKSFWEVFQDLCDEVNAMISPDVVSSLNQSIFGEDGEGEGVDVEFALAHLKNPELDMRNAAEVDGEDEEEDLPMISFTIEDAQDQLY